MPIFKPFLSKQALKTSSIVAIKQAVQNLIDIFKDNWYYIIKSELKSQVSIETYNKYQWLITQEVNVLKRVVKDLSVVYKEPPERKAVIETEEPAKEEGAAVQIVKQEDKNYELSQKNTNKDMVMQRLNQLTNLVNHTLLKITYRKNKLDYDVINFNNAEIFTSKEDWMDIIAVKHYFGLNVENVSNINPSIKLNDGEGIPVTPIQSYSEAKLWLTKDIDKKEVMVTDENDSEILKGGYIYTIKPLANIEIVDSWEPIPYVDADGEYILPFVLFSKEYPFEKLLDFSTGNDLRDLNINVAILMIWLNTLEKYQSFKQIVFNTDDPDKIPNNMVLGPADVLINPTREGGGSVEVLDLQTDIKSKFQVIKERIMTVLAGYGISPENFTMSATPQSGFSLKISNIGKIEARENQISMYRLGERETFEKERIIWNSHNPGKQISKDAVLQIDFVELEFPKSPQEKAMEFNFLYEHNAITELDIIMRNNPDLTEEQAKEEYAKNKAFNEANKPIIQLNPIQQPGQKPKVPNNIKQKTNKVESK